jgi:putative cell wall-binding protein
MSKPARPAPDRLLVLAVLLGVVGSVLPLTARPVTAGGVVPSATVTSERLGGADRYATAVAIAKRIFPSGNAPVVYLTSGATFADALAAGPAAARRGGVVLLTAKEALPAVVEAELIRLSPARVIVLGGPTVVSSAVVARVRDVVGADETVVRVYGADRYATAALVTRTTFEAGEPETVFVASGAAFPDALAAGSVAAVLGAPVLITRPDSLPSSTAAELERLAPERVVIVGGSTAVSSGVAAAIDALVPTVVRASGKDRYSTAVAVAKLFLPDAVNIVVATALDFPDALAAVPLAGFLDGPILLVLPDAVPASTRDAVRDFQPAGITVVGASGAVSPITLGELVGWADGRLSVPPPAPGYPTYDARYHDYGEVVTFIRATEIAFPEIVKIVSIGKSHNGKDIWAAKISDNVDVDED